MMGHSLAEPDSLRETKWDRPHPDYELGYVVCCRIIIIIIIFVHVCICI